MKISNERGAVLIVAYIVLFALMTLSAGLVVFNFNELYFAQRHYRAAAAFWLAEAGTSLFIADPFRLDEAETGEERIVFGPGEITIKKEDTRQFRRVWSTGQVRGVERTIELTYPVKAPEILKHTISVNGDIVAGGLKTAVMIDDKTILSGQVLDEGRMTNLFVEQKQENASASLVTLDFPDGDGNGRDDEFKDFQAFYRDLLKRYPESEIVYIKGNDTYTISPESKLTGRKIVFIDADEGKGNVIIQSSDVLDPDQNLTVVTTGTVTMNLFGAPKDGSQLNIVAWKGYRESAVLPGMHRGLIYTHGRAVFDDIYDSTITYGNVIAEGGIYLGEIWSTKIFKYMDMRRDDRMPPGFEGLIGGGTTGYVAFPTEWKEI